MDLSPRQKGLLILGVTLLLAGLLTVWMLFLNRGSLIIQALPPYFVDLDGAPDQTCAKNPCALKLLPHTYQVIFKKDTFFPETRTFQIKRWQNTEIAITWRLIPTISEVQSWQKPNFDKIEHNLSAVDLQAQSNIKISPKKLPPFTQFIYFSPQANYAIIKSAKDIQFYDLEKVKFEALNLKTPLDLIWSHDEKNIFYLENTFSLGQKLISLNPKTGQTNVITSFPAPIANGQMFLSPQMNKIALLTKQNGDNAIYLIDLKKKWKKRIISLPTINNLTWSPNESKLLLEESSSHSQANNLTLYDLNTQKLEPLDLKSTTQKTVWLDDDHIISATTQKFDAPVNPESLYIDIIKNQFLNMTDSDNIVIYNLKTKQFQYVYTSDKTVYHPERISLDQNKKSILFEQAGKLYQIAMGEL